MTLHLYFLSPFQLYIYFETKWIKGDSFFVRFDFLYRYFSNVSRGNGLFHVTFSQLFEWKKVGKYLSILSGSSLAVCSSNFRWRSRVKYSRLTLEGVSLPREQSHFNVTWMRIFLTDKRDLPGIRDDNLVFLSLLFFLLFYFLSFAKSFPPLKNKKLR